MHIAKKCTCPKTIHFSTIKNVIFNRNVVTVQVTKFSYNILLF